MKIKPKKLLKSIRNWLMEPMPVPKLGMILLIVPLQNAVITQLGISGFDWTRVLIDLMIFMGVLLAIKLYSHFWLRKTVRF